MPKEKVVPKTVEELSKRERKSIQQIDYNGPPTLEFDELLKLYCGTKKILILEDILRNKTTWAVTYQNLWDIIKYGFEFSEIRERIVHFKIHADDKGKPYSLQLRHFISNMIFWYAFAATDSFDLMDESYIYNFIDKPINKVVDYLDEKFVRVIEIDSESMSAVIDEIIFHMTAVAKYTSILVGAGLSIYNIHKTAKANPRIEEILHSRPDHKWQPNEIENYYKERTIELSELLSVTGSDLAPIFKAGKIMSMGQLQEVMVGIGYKSDFEGNVIPFLVDRNIFVDGLSRPSDFLIDAKGARKAAVDSKINLRDPGTYSKRVSSSSASGLLRDDYEMCDSTTQLHYFIRDEKWLLALNGRYYYDDQDDNKMKCIDGFNDKHLIGRTLAVRSPCTCASDNGLVCAYCYGKLFDTCKDLASPGAYAGIVETEPLKQGQLKSKHVNQTNSERIAFNEEFNRDFEFVSSEIVLKDTSSSDENDQDKYLLIDKIYKEEAEEDLIQYFCYEYKIVDAKQNVIYRVAPEGEQKLYFSDSLKALIKRSKSANQLLIAFEDIDTEDYIFTIAVTTAMVTDSTTRIKTLISTNAATENTNLDELNNNMLEALIDSNLYFDAVHHEMIIRGLERKRSNLYEFPDFGPNGDPGDYQILSVDGSLFNSPSPVDSLRQIKLKKQILDPRFYTKTAPSAVDPLFATALADVLPDDHPTLDKSERSVYKRDY